MSWPLVPASELMVKRGGSLNPAKFPDETFELLSIPAFDRDKPEILKGAEIGSSKNCIEPRDVLLSKIVPHIRRCWVVPEKGDYRQIGSGEWIIFRDERFDPGFLKHYFTSELFHRQFMNTVAGVGGSLVRARPAGVERIEIPLPPLEEQKRIATILDKADAIRRKRQQAIQLADDFLGSVFLDMFGDPVTNPKGWEVTSLTSHGTFKNGLNFGDGEAGSSLRYLGVGNFKSLTSIDDMQLLGFIDLNNLPSKSHLLKDGDLVFVRSNGNRALVGRCITVYPGNEPLTFSGFCIRYRQDDGQIEPEYLNYLLRTPSMKQAMLKGGQGANIQNINQKILSSLHIIFPPKKMQGRFCRVVKEFRCSIERLDIGVSATETLFGCVSQKAFSGEL